MSIDENGYSELEEIEENDFQVIIPLKDWRIVFNAFDIKLVEGEEAEVPKQFLETLRTEQVIK